MPIRSISEQKNSFQTPASPYMQGHFALVVHGFQRSAYNDYTRIKSRKGLKIAVLKGTALPEIAQHLFPNAETVLIDQVNEFLKPHIADTFFWTEDSTQDIKTAYKKLSLIIHPGKWPKSEIQATAAFQKIKAAYEALV